MAKVYIKRGAVRTFVKEIAVQTTALVNQLNYEFGLLADIASMQGKATQSKRELIARANAVFIH